MTKGNSNYSTSNIEIVDDRSNSKNNKNNNYMQNQIGSISKSIIKVNKKNIISISSPHHNVNDINNNDYNTSHNKIILFFRFYCCFKRMKNDVVKKINFIKKCFHDNYEMEKIFLTCRQTEFVHSYLYDKDKLFNLIVKEINYDYMNIKNYQIYDEMILIKRNLKA